MTTTKTHGPLTVSAAMALQTILRAAQQNAHVRWLGVSGDVMEGEARCIAHDGGGFLNDGEDIRDGYLHISGIGEWWIDVPHLIDAVHRGEFVIDR